MKLCACLLLYNIFVITNCITRIARPKYDENIVRAHVEKVAGNSSEDFGAITKNVDNGHTFIATVPYGKDNLQLVFTAPKVETFTDFIQEIVDILNTYEAATFKEFFHILDIEIRNYHYEGCRFSELMQNHNTRSLLAGALTTVRENTVTFTKANINEIADVLRDDMYDENVRELLYYINSLYKNYEPEFRRVLNNLNNYNKSKSIDMQSDLVQTIRDGVRTILFNHYSKLDTNTRRELKEKIETFWEENKKTSVLNDLMNSVVNTSPVLVINKTQVLKTIEDKIKEHELAYSSDPKNFLRNKKKILSEETNIDQSENKYDTSIESETQHSDYSADEFASGQSFDTSNSIKHSQERFKAYNTQRYMTLYTEEVSFKSRTTTKTEIIPISEMPREPKFFRRPTTPRYRPRNVSSHRKKKIKKLRTNYDYDMDDTAQDFSESSYDTESGLMLEPNYRPIARVQPDRQREYIKGAKHSNSVSTETMIIHSKRPQNRKKRRKQNVKSKKQNEFRKIIEPEFNKSFNDYVQKKIISLENELTKFKKLSHLRTATNNGADKADVNVLRNGVDDQEIPLKVKYLMQNDYNSYDGQMHIAKNTVKTESTTYTYKPLKPRFENNTNQNRNDTVNKTNVNKIKPSANVNTFHIDTEDLSKEYNRNKTTTDRTTETMDDYQHQKHTNDDVDFMMQARTKM